MTLLVTLIFYGTCVKVGSVNKPIIKNTLLMDVEFT